MKDWAIWSIWSYEPRLAGPGGRGGFWRLWLWLWFIWSWLIIGYRKLALDLTKRIFYNKGIEYQNGGKDVTRVD